MDAGVDKHRHAVDGAFQDRLEMFEIFGQLVKAEILADARHPPGLRDRLEGAEQHLSSVFLVIGAFVWNPQHRHLCQTRDVFGDNVEMLARM